MNANPVRETRFMLGKIEARALTAGERAAGYIGAIAGFIPFARDSRPLRDAAGKTFVERLAPGVFTRSLADAKQVVFADVGHRAAATFARSGINLRLVETQAGLSYTALLPDTSTGRDLRSNVRLGIISGTSFEFELRAGDAAAQAWEKRDALPVRTIRSAILHRVNPVTEPAYLETTLAARALAAYEAGAAIPAAGIARAAEDRRATALRIFTR